MSLHTIKNPATQFTEIVAESPAKRETEKVSMQRKSFYGTPIRLCSSGKRPPVEPQATGGLLAE